MPWFLRMQLTIFPAILVLQIYITIGLYFAFKKFFLQPQKAIKIILFIVVLFLNLFPLLIIFLKLSGLLSQSFIFQNQLHFLDFLLVFPYWWGLISAVEILPYFLLIDLFLLAVILCKWKKKAFLPKYLAAVKILLTIFFMIFVGIRMYLDSYQVRLTPHHVQIKNLPQSLQGLTLTLLGDVQVDRYTQRSKLENLQKKLNQTRSDFLLFSGDLVTSGQFFIEQGLEFLCQQHTTFSRIACMGDHDYWANPTKIANGLKDCGWIFLENSHQLFEYQGQQVLFTAITHIYSQQISVAQLESILENAPEADLKILLVHQPAPKVIETAAKYSYQLVLGGHTHGGQIQFQPLGFTLTPSMFETPYYSGGYQVGNTTVIVTNGVGLTLAPVRYRARAEINVITLSSK